VLHLDLDDLAPRTPQLPRRQMGAMMQLAVSAALHLTLVVVAPLVRTTFAPDLGLRQGDPTAERVRHVVFLAPDVLRMGGGGGGGQQQSERIQRAQGVGSDRVTLRARKPLATVSATTPAAPAAEAVPPLPPMVLHAKPLASGNFEQGGLPTGATMSGTSTGPGDGSGVGSGIGTGLGSGSGPGLGPGSGGGSGGGIYRPGGSVSTPRVIREVKPRYTTEGLRQKIQGSVVLEVVVKADGCPSHIRVVKSLNRGLDEEAMAAVAQWRFEPGRLAGAPVDVLVTIMLDFSVR
jgi:TonB family protein